MHVLKIKTGQHINGTRLTATCKNIKMICLTKNIRGKGKIKHNSSCYENYI